MQNKIHFNFIIILVIFFTLISMKCNKNQGKLEEQYIKIDIYNKKFEVKDIQSYVYWAPYESLSIEYVDELKNSFLCVQITNHSPNKIKFNLSKGNIIDMKRVIYQDGDSVVFFNDGWLPGDEFIIEPYSDINSGILWSKTDTIGGNKNIKSDSTKLIFVMNIFQHGYWNKKIEIPVKIISKKFEQDDRVSHYHYLNKLD